jgi:hypothetical protein
MASMSETTSSVTSILRKAGASLLVAIAVLLLVLSGPLRAGWGFVGSSSNASATAIALMKDPAVQLAAAQQIETQLQQASSPDVAHQLALQQKVLTGAVVTLLKNPMVQGLVAQEVTAAYTAATTNTKTSLNFTPLVDQVTAVLHTVAPSIPAKISLGSKLIVTVDPKSTSYSSLKSLGSGSVVLWFLGLAFVLLAALALLRTRLSQFIAVGVGFGLSALLLLVLAKAAHSIATGINSTNPLSKSVVESLSSRFGSSLVHSALLDLLTGVIIAAGIFGLAKWREQKHTSPAHVAD